jgi:hypothetical protein
MDMPVFGTCNRQINNINARLAVVCYLLVIVVSMSMAKPANASGTVNLTTLYYGGWNSSGYNCSGMSSLNEVQDCMLAMHDKWLSDDLSGLNSNTALLPPQPLTCPAATLNDSGPSSGYVDVFHITFYRGGVNAAGWSCCPINYKICDGPKVDDFNISTNLGCPVNSQPNGSTCTCNDNFMPDATATSCVPGNSCPANMSGSPCVCNTDYVPDPNGPGCVYQTLTLTIESAYSANEPFTTEPRGILALKAVVKDQFGLPKVGKQVTLTVEVQSGSGGHDHDVNRPKGEVCAQLFGCVQDSKGTQVATDGSGEAGFVFRAPPPAGEHTITATCTGCNSASAEVKVMVPDLIPIPASQYYALQDLAGNVIGAIKNKHTDNHYLTAQSITKLEEFARKYQTEVLPGAKLYLNDASLVWGGLFDVGSTPWASPHITHDKGRSIDIRAENSGPNNEGAVPTALFNDAIKAAARTGAKAALHCASSTKTSVCSGDPEFRHFHIDF